MSNKSSKKLIFMVLPIVLSFSILAIVALGSGEESELPIGFIMMGIFQLLFMAMVVLMITQANKAPKIKIENQTISIPTGIFGNSTKQLSTQGVSKILVLKETRGSGKNRRSVFVTYTSGNTGREHVYEGQYEPSREISERLSKALMVDIEDHSSGSAIIRSHKTLDMSIGQKIREGYEKVPSGPQPLETKIKMNNNHQSKLSFTLPLNGWHMTNIFIMGFSLVGVVFFSIPVLFSDGPWFIPLVPLAFFSPVALFMYFIREKIEVSSANLTIKKQLLFITYSTFTIPLNELEELFLVQRSLDSMAKNYDKEITPEQKAMMQRMKVYLNSGILARSDTKKEVFAALRTEEEKAWIIATILTHIVTQSSYQQAA